MKLRGCCKEPVGWAAALDIKRATLTGVALMSGEETEATLPNCYEYALRDIDCR
jgi:hypothetical protein